MRSVSSTQIRLSLALFTVLISTLGASAQQNSPFTRYGLGEHITSPHAISRSLGGLSAVYSDGSSNNIGQAVNFMNPATYSNYFMVVYDLGLTVDSRTLRSETPNGKFSSKYFYPSYLAVGVPISRKKNLGMAFGLKPVTRINYSVNSSERVAGDSVGTIYEGSGGLNQVFVGLGKKWKGLSVGFNTGFSFGRKEISTKKIILNDSVNHYQSNSATYTSFNKLFLNAGFQYEVGIGKKVNAATKNTTNYYLRLGATYDLDQRLSASQDIRRETYTETASGEVVIDTVAVQYKIPGTIQMPSTFTGGLNFRKTMSNNRGVFEVLSIGAEYSTTQWNKFRFYNQSDPLINSWQMRIGAQICPDPISGKGYWSNVNYRAGFFMGKDYVDADGNGLKYTGFSLGASLPIKKWTNYDQQFTNINTSLQFGKRGTGVNNITESYFQLTLGFSLTDVWFQKRMYD